MGLAPAPQMANGTLQKEEYSFQEHMTRTNYSVAKSLNHTFRYIDDITPLNDKGNFEKYFTQIYPPELELNRENVGFKSATVLEMDVNVVDNKFLVGVYDKRDSFNFEVFNFENYFTQIYPPELELNRENVGFKSATVLEMDVNVVDNKFLVGVYDKRDSFNFEVFRYPSFESNIPNRIIYNVFLGQLVRFSRVCNFEEGFVTATKLLVSRMVKKGAKEKILKAYFTKFFGKHRVPYTTREASLTKIFNP